MTMEIDRVRNIDAQEFHEHYSKRGRPVILQGGIEQWPARMNWSLDYFSNKFPDKSLQFGGKPWVLGKFIGRLRDGEIPAPYLKEVKIDEQFPELKGDIGSLEYARKN